MFPSSSPFFGADCLSHAAPSHMYPSQHTFPASHYSPFSQTFASHTYPPAAPYNLPPIGSVYAPTSFPSYSGSYSPYTPPLYSSLPSNVSPFGSPFDFSHFHLPPYTTEVGHAAPTYTILPPPNTQYTMPPPTQYTTMPPPFPVPSFPIAPQPGTAPPPTQPAPAAPALDNLKVLVTGTAKLFPEAVAKATAAIKAMQSESRKEPGCFDFLWSFAIEDPNMIHIFEVWDNEAALAKHLDAEHVKIFKEVVPDIFIEDPKVQKAAVHSTFEDI